MVKLKKKKKSFLCNLSKKIGAINIFVVPKNIYVLLWIEENSLVAICVIKYLSVAQKLSTLMELPTSFFERKEIKK